MKIKDGLKQEWIEIKNTQGEWERHLIIISDSENKNDEIKLYLEDEVSGELVNENSPYFILGKEKTIEKIIEDILYQGEWLKEELNTLEHNRTETLLLVRQGLEKAIEDLHNEIYDVEDSIVMIESKELEND